jgi:hypothetical protein
MRTGRRCLILMRLFVELWQGKVANMCILVLLCFSGWPQVTYSLRNRRVNFWKFVIGKFYKNLLIYCSYILNGTTVNLQDFMFCWPCISVYSVNNQLDAQFFFSFMFISILYMFRAAMCSSSGELIVSIRHLVYVTLYRGPFSVHTKRSSIYTEWHIPDVVLIQLIFLMMGTWLPEICRE